jgi:hypothetical protein
VMWYHHYLQHPGHTRLEETINAAMYWKGMRTTIRSITKSCKTCQTNKKRIRAPPGKDRYKDPLGSLMCRPHWSIHS